MQVKKSKLEFWDTPDWRNLFKLAADEGSESLASWLRTAAHAHLKATIGVVAVKHYWRDLKRQRQREDLIRRHPDLTYLPPSGYGPPPITPGELPSPLGGFKHHPPADIIDIQPPAPPAVTPHPESQFSSYEEYEAYLLKRGPQTTEAVKEAQATMKSQAD